MTPPFKALRDKWMKDPAFVKAYQEQAPMVDLAMSLIEAREKAGLSQQQIAERMGTSQSAVSRMESGRARPSLASLEAFAKATGAKLKIELELT